MIDQDYLRNCVKKLKWNNDICFKEISGELLGISYHSFINWKRGEYDLSEEKARELLDYVECLIDE